MADAIVFAFIPNKGFLEYFAIFIFLLCAFLSCGYYFGWDKEEG
ncbi:hypothetical protein [Brevibacillus laterosporus]